MSSSKFSPAERRPVADPETDLPTLTSTDPMQSTQGKEHRPHVWSPYCQMKTAAQPVHVVSTDGVRLTLADGRELIDGLASWWSVCHGYNHPHVVGSMKSQLESMSHVMFGGVQHSQANRLAARLAHLLPGALDHVFFSDSGSVAVEVAMKLAIQFHRNRGDNHKHRFLAFHHAYHGDTTGAMSLCDPHRSMHHAFGDGILSQFHAELPATKDGERKLVEMMHRHQHELAAVFIEPLVQGAGGMRFHSAEVLGKIAEICADHDVLLVADELATGFGRTGSMFAIEQANVVPDVICLGKALSAGSIGLAATVASSRVFDEFWSDDASHALMHGPTFMGNPLACAAANASLDLFEREDRLQQVATIERQLRSELASVVDIPGVVDVRVKGAIGVLQVDRLDHVVWLRQSFVEQGIWLRPFGDCIYTTPPLTISEVDLRKITSAMTTITRAWSERKQPSR
ncbi:MAG: adenosylmethionine--8-amino-7-oxononanoate transaminase [Planctomycetota bacterium]